MEGFSNVTAVAAIPRKPAQFAIANAGGLIGIVDVTTGKDLRRWRTDLNGNITLALNADGSRLAVTARGATEIQVYLIADGTREKVVPTPSAGIVRLAFSPDGNLLAAFGLDPKDPKISLVDLRDGTVRWQRPGDRIYGGAIFSPDGTRLFVGMAAIRKLAIIGVEKGDVISTLDAQLTCMALSRDGRRIAVGLGTGGVVIDVATSAEMQRAPLHSGRISSLAWTAGDNLITVGGDGEFARVRHKIRLWSANFAARGTFFGIEERDNFASWDYNPQSGHLLAAARPPRLCRIPADLGMARIVSETVQGWSTCFLSDTVMVSRDRKADSLALYDVTNPRAPKELPPPGPNGYSMSASCWSGELFALGRKASGAPVHLDITQLEIASPETTDDQLLAVNDALEKLAAVHPPEAELVKLRYFAGLTLEQAAASQEVSFAAAKHSWTFARAWLHREMTA